MMMKLEERFNRFYDSLVEAKEDWDKFEGKFGTELMDKFKSLNKRLPVGERSIYSWMDRDKWELEHALAEIEHKKTRSQKDNKARSGVETIQNSDPNNWTVLKIKTYEASKKYGANTKWCVSGTKPFANGRTPEDTFNDYVNKNHWDLYFIINKKSNKKYAALVVDGDAMEMWDEQDNSIKSIPNGPKIPEIDKNYVIYRDVVAANGPYQLLKADKNVDGKASYFITNRDDEFDLYVLYGNAILDNNNRQAIELPELCNIDSDIESLLHSNDDAEEIYDLYHGRDLVTTPERLNMLKYGNFKYNVDDGIVDIPKNAKNIYIDGSGSKIIPPHAFENSNIEFAYIFGVDEIGEYAFAGCKKLRGIDKAETLKKIDDYAFKDCKSLLDVYFWDAEDNVNISPKAFIGARFEKIDSPYSWKHKTRRRG